MLRYIEKDITTVQEGIVLHGCNCQGVMGSGVALAIKNRWPKAFREYSTLCRQTEDTSTLLGKVQTVTVEPGIYIYVCNGFTQVFYGTDKVHAKLGAITSIVSAVIAHNYRNLPIYIPKIGSLRGGLDWDCEVAPAIEGVIGDSEVIVCEFEG